MIDGTLEGWKNGLVSSQVVNVSKEEPKIDHSVNGLVISLPNAWVDHVTSSLKFCVLGRFVAFTPKIEMACKWVSENGR